MTQIKNIWIGATTEKREYPEKSGAATQGLSLRLGHAAGGRTTIADTVWHFVITFVVDPYRASCFPAGIRKANALSYVFHSRNV